MELPKIQNHILGKGSTDHLGQNETILVTGDSIEELAKNLRGRRFHDVVLTITIRSKKDLEDMVTLADYIERSTCILGKHYNDLKKERDKKK